MGAVVELSVGLNNKPHFVPAARQASIISAGRFSKHHATAAEGGALPHLALDLAAPRRNVSIDGRVQCIENEHLLLIDGAYERVTCIAIRRSSFWVS